MSKANGTSAKAETYLQHVSLKNYKSIKDAEIDFKPGLNIIIGKNASGKTNFVNGLHYALNFQENSLLNSEFSLNVILKDAEIDYHTIIKQPIYDDMAEYNGMVGLISNDRELMINKEIIQIPDNQLTKNFLFDHDHYLLDVLIKHGTNYTDESLFVSVPLSFNLIVNGKIALEVFTRFRNGNNSIFLEAFFFRMMSHLSILNEKENFDQYFVENNIIVLKQELSTFCSDRLNNIKNAISTCSPIRQLRVSPNFEIRVDRVEKKVIITNFYLEFLIDETWLTFQLLSDGTKRVFYLVSELLGRDTLMPINSDDHIIALLEEPELGIHPHQLHLLMQFIKEQSRYKQIIITTHSPQVLDTIGSDELDRIIICEYDAKNGTQLRHLNEKETSKAKIYMEDAFLSDYWRFSDLEPVS